MSVANGERTYQFKALSDLWTGSVTLEEKNGQIKEKTGPGRLITTGLLGSIRWWLEVLVRGLGGNACDPSPEDRKMNPPECRCPNKKVDKANDPGHHCVVCELFGCTGWARKFRFEVLDEKGNIREVRANAGTKISPQIMKNEKFILRFTPIRPICREEWALLDATLRLIADYGAIGGKTVFKPTDEPSRAKEIHHQDFGIVKIEKVDPPITNLNVAEVEKYVRQERWRKPEPKAKDADFAWASLKLFWFVEDKTLMREKTNASSFNKVLGRKDSKVCIDCGQVHNPPNKCPKTKRYPERESEHLFNKNDEISKWLAGSQQESKKVFSFKNPARTFGFVKPELIDFPTMKDRLQKVWPGLQDSEFREGPTILDELLPKEDRS
jgi:CRISPR-associated protein Cmr1